MTTPHNSQFTGGDGKAIVVGTQMRHRKAEVTVEYNGAAGRRVTRTFPGMAAARKFYVKMAAGGNDPKIVGTKQ